MGTDSEKLDWFRTINIVGEKITDQELRNAVYSGPWVFDAEGIRIAKLKGAYKGRQKGSSEDLLSFLNKDRNKKAVEYMKKGYKNTEISKITGLHINTLTKIKSVLNHFNKVS